MKKLIILDLNKNYVLQRDNCNYLNINRGLIKFHNATKIEFNVNKNPKILKEFIKSIKIFFNKIKNEVDKNFSYINSLELEFFNLRNDKYGYLDKMFVLFCLKKKNFHKKFDIEVLSDDISSEEIYKDLFGKKVDIKILKKNYNSFDTSYLLLKYLKFLFKASYFIILNNLVHKKKNLPNKQNIFLSFFPYFYNGDDINLYTHKEKNYLNFSLTDETHLNLKTENYLNHLKKISKNKKIFSVEKEISFYDLMCSLGKFYLEKKKLNILPKKIFYYQNINCFSFLYPHLKISLFNRSKLFIYEKFLNKLNYKNKLNIFHYFLFEYNFGFFLRRKLDKIKFFLGYQHGIYTKNLMWLSLINDKASRKVIPKKVICNRKESFKVYKKHFKDISLKKKDKINIKIKISKNKNEKNLLVFMGQHDIDDILYYFFNKKEYKDKKIYFKLHPNNKKLITFKSKNFYFINKIDVSKRYKVFLSPTTTLIYDFIENKIKFNIIKYDYKINLWG